RTVLLWDYPTGRELGELAGHRSEVSCLAFARAPGHLLLAWGSADGTVKLCDVVAKAGDPSRREGKVRRTLTGHTKRVSAVVLGPGPLLASASEDGTVRVWDLDTGQGRVLADHGARVEALALSPDGTTLAAGCSDRLVRLWGLAGQAQEALHGHANRVVGVA